MGARAQQNDFTANTGEGSQPNRRGRRKALVVAFHGERPFPLREQNRARKLAALFRAIEEAQSHGESLRSAARRLRSRRGLSISRILELFIAWRRAHRSDAVLRRNYAPANRGTMRLRQAQRSKITRLLRDPRTRSLEDIRVAVPLRVGRSQWYRRLAPSVRRRAHALYLARHEADRAERALAQALIQPGAIA